MKTKMIAGMIVAAVITALPLASQGTTVTTIMGSGIPDDGWTTGSGGNIDLALRARTAYVGGALPNSGGTYYATTGTAPAPHSSQANWNFDLSVSTPELFRYDFYLSVDTSAGPANTPLTFSPTLYTDNSYGSFLTPNGAGVEGLYADNMDRSVMQNSQNIMFFPQSLSLFDPNSPGEYDYSLYAVRTGTGADGTKLAEVNMKVVVGGLPIADLPVSSVPDGGGTAASLALCFMGLLFCRAKYKTARAT